MNFHPFDCQCDQCREKRLPRAQARDAEETINWNVEMPREQAIKAQSLCDELRREIQAMAATIEAQERLIAGFRDAADAQQKILERLESKSGAREVDMEGWIALAQERAREATSAKIRLNEASRVLSAFYRAPLSMSSVQPVLLLAEELNPSLKAKS